MTTGQKRSILRNPRLVWPLVLLLAGGNAAIINMLVSNHRADHKRSEQMQVAQALSSAQNITTPYVPPPPKMIDPPAVAAMLQSGIVIVVSKPSQTMFVFKDGALWDSSPVSTGKRGHQTPSGVFPILQKREFHRSNIYSNAPMPFMQRLTWDGIALHAGRVPGYAASHGCIRMPHGFAQSLFKLTKASATTVVIGDEPLGDAAQAQQFALAAPGRLPIRSALAPPPSERQLAEARATQLTAGVALARQMSPFAPPSSVEVVSVEVASVEVASANMAKPLTPVAVAQPSGGETIQLTAAASQAEADAHWTRLVGARPDISRFQKRVEAADVNARRIYRLRLSGAGAHDFCAQLKRDGVDCLEVG